MKRAQRVKKTPSKKERVRNRMEKESETPSGRHRDGALEPEKDPKRKSTVQRERGRTRAGCSETQRRRRIQRERNSTEQRERVRRRAGCSDRGACHTKTKERRKKKRRKKKRMAAK